MDKKFYMAQRSKENEALMKYPPAYMLLAQIAFRAKRTNGFDPNGLEVGQAMVGDYRNIGLSEKQYRTAKSKLEKWQFAAFKGTPFGTIATLTSTAVYDINEEGGANGGANKGRTKGEQRATKKNDNNVIMKEEEKNSDFLEPENSEGTEREELEPQPKKQTLKSKKENSAKEKSSPKSEREYLVVYEKFMNDVIEMPPAKWTISRRNKLKEIKSYLEKHRDGDSESALKLWGNILSERNWKAMEEFYQKFFDIESLERQLSKILHGNKNGWKKNGRKPKKMEIGREGENKFKTNKYANS